MYRKTACLISILCLLIALPHVATAKLLSSSLAQDRAKRAIEEIFRQTRLNEGEQVWGERYREEITRFAKFFSMNYYQIFLDLGISNAMARAAMYAKYDDAQRWLDQIKLFDRAAEELDPKDKAKYYFAKGLLQIQCIPDKMKNFPEDFYKAAENGYSSTFIAEYIGKDKSVQNTAVDASYASDILERLAQSYERGGYYEEAYKFYMLSARSGNPDPDIFVALTANARNGGSEVLAYKTGLLFLEIFSAYEGKNASHAAIINSLNVNPGMSAEEIWKYCEADAITSLLSNKAVATPSDLNSRQMQRSMDDFENRYLEAMAKSMGNWDDMFRMTACEKYWQNPDLVKRLLLRINGAIDSHSGAMESFINKVREDARFSADADIAQWEARRWKAAKKLNDFAQQFPERYQLAGSPK
jgi:hypothetical protein